MISNPLKLYDCATNTDGAAGVIVCSEERAKDLTDKPVFIRGTAQVNDGYPWANYPKDWSTWPTLEYAANPRLRDGGHQRLGCRRRRNS